MADAPPPQGAIAVLFVCLGNICRSTMAEAVFTHTLASRPSSSSPAFSVIDSAGTIDYHAGKSPDPRTMAVLEKHGITSYTHKARRVRPEDFEDFNYIFAMDSENLSNLQSMRNRTASQRKKNANSSDKELARVMLFGTFGGKSKDEEVIDPFYGAGKGFDMAFEQMQRFSAGFLRSLEESSK